MNRVGKLLYRMLLMVLVGTGFTHAKVSDDEAARLGADLNPFGGEIAGNEDGSIPAWNPKWKGLPPGLEYGGPGEKRPNPYAGEQPMLTITSANYQQHKQNLSEGQIALFERYPEFHMEIYQSHRDFGFQDRMVEKVKWNVTHTELINNSESIKHFTGGVAFPIPQGPEEVLWNTRTNACHQSYQQAYDGYGVFANGERAHNAVNFRTSSPFNNPEYAIPTTEEDVGDRVVWTLTERIAPPRQKGEVTAVQDPLDYKNNKRNAWQYNPGTRRVRKAPAIGYDNPDGPGGMQTIDDHKGFNGAFDRFAYTLLGRKEVYVPYHNYDFNNNKLGTLDDRLTPNFLNPQYLRFELHRVWVVQGDLAPGKRHVYSKRRWFIDEDSWNPVMSENFDSRGALWRVGMFLSDYQYDIECYEKHSQVFMDLPSGGYISSFITIDRRESDHSIPYMRGGEFTPANLRKIATR